MLNFPASSGVRTLINKIEEQQQPHTASNTKHKSNVTKISGINNDQTRLVSQSKQSVKAGRENIIPALSHEKTKAAETRRGQISKQRIEQHSAPGAEGAQKTAPKQTTQFKNGIPKEIHFAWEGKDISEDGLANILLNAKLSPDFNINIWTTTPSLIFTTLDKMANSESNASHRFLARKYGPVISLQDTNNLFDELKTQLQTSEGMAPVADGEFLASMFYREINGAYQNLAAASDITRAALMFLKGGCYMDVDVVCRSLKELGNNNIPHGYLIGRSDDNSGLPNAFLVSLPGSTMSKDILEKMAYEMILLQHNEQNEKKPHDLTLWINKRSITQDRKHHTTALTGPELFYNMRLQRNKGIFFDADVSTKAKANVKDVGTKANVKKSKADLSEKTVNEVLFADFKKGFNDDAGWVSLASVKGKPPTTL